MSKTKPTLKTWLGATALTAAASVAQADILQLDDVIIDGSLCVGFDCVNGESFGFDTIRLKENNLRIKAQDTSTSASFPTTDWQITFNATSNGGANKFSIDDIDAGRTPFTIEANAPTNALYVDDGGRLGLGTSVPVADIHAKTGNTPTLRLEQDGSSGFASQTFDVAANEANFFIRDATNGSTLPFRIRPGAPSSSIDIAANGDVGIGDSSPDYDLDLQGDANNARFAMSTTDSSEVGIVFNRKDDQLRISDEGDADLEFIFTDDGDLTILGTLTTGGGTCGGGCDRVFDETYDLPSITEHAQQMWSAGYLPNVGPTIENQPINLSDKLGRMLNELEHAHIYIDQLNQRIETLEKALADKG